MKKYKLIKEYPGSPSVGATTGGFNDANNIYYNIYMGDFLGTRIHRFYIENFPEFWKELKEPLFTTEDGVDMYEGNNAWIVTSRIDGSWENPYIMDIHASDMHYECDHWFSNEKAAKEYIAKNTPKYSERDIEKAFKEFVKDITIISPGKNIYMNSGCFASLFFNRLKNGKEVKQG